MKKGWIFFLFLQKNSNLRTKLILKTKHSQWPWSKANNIWLDILRISSVYRAAYLSSVILLRLSIYIWITYLCVDSICCDLPICSVPINQCLPRFIGPQIEILLFIKEWKIEDFRVLIRFKVAYFYFDNFGWRPNYNMSSLIKWFMYICEGSKDTMI